MAIQRLNVQQQPNINIQLDTTNSTPSGVKVQTGWGQILGAGASSLSETVTFPVAFTAVYSVTISFLGFKSGGTAATDITQFNSAISGGNMVQTNSITLSSFVAMMQSTGTFGAAYHGYSWIAYGV